MCVCVRVRVCACVLRCAAQHAHSACIIKALAKVHQTDNTVLGPVLLLPAVGLSASAALALVAVAINKLTG